MLRNQFSKKAAWGSHGNQPGNTSLRIAIVAASPGAGASFITGILAASLRSQRRVTVAELGKPYFYEALDMEKRCGGDPFWFYDMAGLQRSVGETLNLADGINWAVRAPGSGPCTDLAMALRCMNRLPGDVILLDCSSLDSSIASVVMAEADQRIVVVDPLPSRMLAAVNYLNELNACQMDRTLVVNKMNQWVRKKELSHCIGTSHYAEVPLLEEGLIYKAEYEGVLPADLGECSYLTGLVIKMISEV